LDEQAEEQREIEAIKAGNRVEEKEESEDDLKMNESIKSGDEENPEGDTPKGEDGEPAAAGSGDEAQEAAHEEEENKEEP
jgi:hypothetical protein